MVQIDLLTLSRMWHEEADKLLNYSQISSILSRLGEVKIVGSYDYNLMLGPDLDIYVILPEDKAKAAALDALNQLIKQNYWNGYLYYDFVVHSSKNHPGFPKAYYVGVKRDFSSSRWKVDIWFGQEDTLRVNNDWIKDNLNDENKKLILKLKAARNDGEINTDSHDIYLAVLRNNVKNVEEFKKWSKHIT